jgi:hypothetical protein
MPTIIGDIIVLLFIIGIYLFSLVWVLLPFIILFWICAALFKK